MINKEYRELKFAMTTAEHSLVKHRFFAADEGVDLVLLKLTNLETAIANYKATLTCTKSAE